MAFKSVEKSKSEIFNVPLVQTSYQGIVNNDSIYYKESKGRFVLNVLQDTFEDLMKNLHNIIGNKAVPFLYPIVENRDFKGYINVIDMAQRVIENGKLEKNMINMT